MSRATSIAFASLTLLPIASLAGEGAIDAQTLMGKGVGQIALLCKKRKIPCIGMAGVVTEPEKAKKFFTQTYALIEMTSVQDAKLQPAKFLEELATRIARDWN